MRLFPLLVVLVGCTTANNFGTQAAGVACSNLESCERTDFESRWDNKGECVDELEPFFGGDCYTDNCDTFDATQANACLSGVRSSECGDDAPASCTDVWSDCNAFDLGACLLAEGVQLF